MKLACGVALAAALALVPAAPGQAASFDVSGVLGQTEVCTDAGCNTEIYNLGSSSELTGSLVIEDGSYTLEVSVDSADLTALAGGDPLGLNGWTFQSSGSVSGTVFQSLSGSTDVDGWLYSDASPVGYVQAPGVSSTGSCIDIGSGDLSCTLGLISSDISYDIAGTGVVYMSQTLDFLAARKPVPEPAAILLLLGPLAILARRRAS